MKVNGTASQAKFTSLAYVTIVVKLCMLTDSRQMVLSGPFGGEAAKSCKLMFQPETLLVKLVVLIYYDSVWLKANIDVTNLLSSSEFEVAGDNLSGIAYFSSSKHLCRSFNNNQFGYLCFSFFLCPHVCVCVRVGGEMGGRGCRVVHSSRIDMTRSDTRKETKIDEKLGNECDKR